MKTVIITIAAVALLGLGYAAGQAEQAHRERAAEMRASIATVTVAMLRGAAATDGGWSWEHR